MSNCLKYYTLHKSYYSTYWLFSHCSSHCSLFLVDGPDTVSVTPNHSTHVVNDGEVLDDITCTAECVPSCTYEWKKNGTESFSTERTLSLGQLTRSDSGLYTCSVGNSDTGIQVTKNIDVTVNVRCKYIMWVFILIIMLPKGGRLIVAALPICPSVCLSIHPVPCPANNFNTTVGI